MDLENQRKMLQEEVEEELESKENELRELDNKYLNTVEQMQKRHQRDKQKIQVLFLWTVQVFFCGSWFAKLNIVDH